VLTLGADADLELVGERVAVEAGGERLEHFAFARVRVAMAWRVLGIPAAYYCLSRLTHAPLPTDGGPD
jgi:hypothetical protein